MFTGIVEELGMVVETGPRLAVACCTVAEDSDPGASVAVNGVCLTVVSRDGDGDRAVLGFDLSPETLARSSLGSLRPGGGVNLERPTTLVGRLGGHLVQGHVDGVGVITQRNGVTSGAVLRIELPDGLTRYLVEKGSIAVDGVSLTVTDITEKEFGVALIPYTLEATTLGRAAVGDTVNLEVDVIAKYVESLTRGLR
jgi:riboflavin synthase